jgi:hypothetical protein
MFIRWVMDVCPLRLLNDLTAVCVMDDNQHGYDQAHGKYIKRALQSPSPRPRPPILVFSGSLALFEKPGCSCCRERGCLPQHQNCCHSDAEGPHHWQRAMVLEIAKARAAVNRFRHPSTLPPSLQRRTCRPELELLLSLLTHARARRDARSCPGWLPAAGDPRFEERSCVRWVATEAPPGALDKVQQQPRAVAIIVRRVDGPVARMGHILGNA